MGSEGTGRFDDYRRRRAHEPEDQTDEDRCLSPLTGVSLDDVARCPRYRQGNSLPGKGDLIRVRRELHNGRIAVEDPASRLVVGLLPTALNYLLGCMEEGHEYEGEVTDSSVDPFPSVTVDIHPV
jgi:hypothetical protein